MAGRGAGGGPGKSDVHLGAVRGGGPRRSKHPPLRAAGGVSFRPEAGSQHLAFHSRERVLRCIDQYTARQYRHQSGQKEALAFARTSSCTSKTVSRVLYQTVIYLDVPSPVRSSHPGSGRASLGGRTPCSHTGVAPDRVYSIGQSPADGCALTAPFHPYRQSYSLSVRVAYRSLRERPLRRADFNREEGPFVPLHTTPLRRSAQGQLRCSGKFPSPRSAGHRVQPSLFP